MSYIYSRALVEEYLADNYSDIDASALSSSSRTPKPSWARQNDGTFPPFPIWDDVRTFDGTPWNGVVDVVCGGFPCQDISAAGKGAGIDGSRSGLWGEMARIIGEIRPRFVFVENSPMLTSRGLGRVLGDLAEMGFDARWGVLGADHVGAQHKRERIWIFADADQKRRGRWWNLQKQGRERIQLARLVGKSRAWEESAEQKSKVLGVGDGVAHVMDRLNACGNGQVPQVAAAAFTLLSGE